MKTNYLSLSEYHNQASLGTALEFQSFKSQAECSYWSQDNLNVRQVKLLTEHMFVLLIKTLSRIFWKDRTGYTGTASGAEMK